MLTGFLMETEHFECEANNELCEITEMICFMENIKPNVSMVVCLCTAKVKPGGFVHD